MDYELDIGEVQYVIDPTLPPEVDRRIVSSTQPDLPKGPGLAATMSNLGGFLVVTGNYAGTLPFDIYRSDGSTLRHNVTVNAGPPPPPPPPPPAPTPGDWSLGDDA